jgi:hypothetical protein
LERHALTAVLPIQVNPAFVVNTSRAWIGAAALQGALALAAILVLALAPPPFGRFLLIPLNGHRIGDELLRQQLLDRRGSGLLPGSVIVDGQSAGAQALLSRGILMLAAPALICGTHGESNAS